MRMKPHQMTLVYARALQCWVENADLLVSGGPHPLARCVRKLRWHVGRHITCNEQDILDRLRDVPPKDKEGETPLVDSSTMTDIEDAWPSPVQTSLVENSMRPADEGEDEEQMYPSWIRVHFSQKVAATGGVPGECGPILPGGPSELALQDKEDKGADSMDAPGVSKAPISLLEPSLRMVISTSVGSCHSTGTIFMSTLTTSVEVMNLEAPSEAEGHQGSKVKELAGEDLAGGCP